MRVWKYNMWEIVWKYNMWEIVWKYNMMSASAWKYNMMSASVWKYNMMSASVYGIFNLSVLPLWYNDEWIGEGSICFYIW